MQPYRIQSAYYAAINAACLSHGIAMPNPAYDIDVRSLAPIVPAARPPAPVLTPPPADDAMRAQPP
jgi:hypothetical protein